jgi:hypothetical protein
VSEAATMLVAGNETLGFVSRTTGDEAEGFLLLLL